MKKLIFLGLALAVLAAGAAWFLIPRTGTLTVQVVLGEGGADVTDQVLVTVIGRNGPLAATPSQKPTFSVQADETLEITAKPRATGPTLTQSHVATSSETTVTLSLQAAQVNFVLRTEAEGPPARLVLDDATGAGPLTTPLETGDETQITRLMAPGDVLATLEAGDYSAQLPLSLEVGQTQDVTLDARTGTVSFLVEGWPHQADPLVFLVTTDKTFGGQLPIDRGQARTLVYGPHQVEVGRGTNGFFRALPGVEPLTINVTAPEQTFALPLPFQIYRVRVENLPDTLAVPPEIAVVETGYKGEFYGGTNLEGEEALIAFTNVYGDTSPEFAVAVRLGGEVRALHPVGTWAPGTQTDITVTFGEGMDLCAKVYGPDTCAPPSE